LNCGSLLPLKSPQLAAAMVTTTRGVIPPEKLGDYVAVKRAAGCTEGKRLQASAVQDLRHMLPQGT
jgi:hypothetical protein